MVSRIILSLKKAADSSQIHWSLTQETTNSNTSLSMLRFSPRRKGSIQEEDIEIPLDTFHEP